jgi:hypothetical protein
MANYTKTISNSIRAQGIGVRNVWGVMVWGVDLWGNTKDTKVLINKYISDTVSSSDIVYSKITRKISNSISCAGSMNLVSLLDGSGYTYVLQGGVTDPDNRLFPSYTSGSLTAPVYTEDSSNSTTWVTA